MLRGSSAWSNVRTVIIYPLFVGLDLRLDGEGYIRGDWNYDVGAHVTRNANAMTDADTIRIRGHQWYDPNPWDWDSDTWDTFTLL